MFQRRLAVVALAVLSASCAPHSKQGPIPADAASVVASSPIGTLSPDARAALTRMGEDPRVQSYQVWLKKDFWLKREIWVSVGVERASITGLAMSVIGYIPARLERNGNNLVMNRNTRGLFGGTALAPEIGINSYPIVGESPDSILVDMAAPQVSFGLGVADLFYAPVNSVELQPRFSYLKSIDLKDQSLSFQTVVTARSPVPLYDQQDGSPESLAMLDPYSVSLTLRTDWVLPLESPAFVPKPSEMYFGFFTNQPLVLSSGTSAVQPLNRIDISKTMNWEISANTPAEYVDTLKGAITAWNVALGKDTLKVKVADGNRSYTDPSASNLVWDDNEGVGIAFANWRSNPFTGEIVQAQVYMSGNMWAKNALMTYRLRQLEKTLRESSGPGPNPLPFFMRELMGLEEEFERTLSKTAGPTNRRLFLAPNVDIARERAGAGNFCMRTVDQRKKSLKYISSIKAQLKRALAKREGAQPAESLPVLPPLAEVVDLDLIEHMPYPAEGLSAEEFSKNVLRGVVMHEVGHTIGLRHNFMGSLGKSANDTVDSGSIMDYNDLVVDAQFTEPGNFDKIVVNLGYRDQAPTPDLKFCTDEHAWGGVADCAPFDISADPARQARITEKTNLLMAQHYLRQGNVELGIMLVQMALFSVQEQQNYLFGQVDRLMLISEEDLKARQETVWSNLAESRRMHNLEFPAELKGIYSEVVSGVLASTASGNSQSVVLDKVVADLVSTATDPEGKFFFLTRTAAVDGLRRLQDFRGRSALKALLSKLEWDVQRPPAGRKPEDIQEDEEVLNSIKKVLAEGYFNRT
jgi:hypothetical protein